MIFRLSRGRAVNLLSVWHCVFSRNIIVKSGLKAGERVIVEGIVDRMDVLEREGVRYVRVVDY